MADFYDRLELALADATERGVRRRVRVRGSMRRRGDWLAAAAALAVTVAVVAVIAIVAGDHRLGQRPVNRSQPAVVTNYGPHRLPVLGGQMVCDTELRAPGGGGSARGVVVVNTRPPTRFVFSLTASGLAPNARANAYAVWLLPATRLASGAYQLLSGQTLLLVGVVRPSVARTGLVAVEGLLPQSASGDYLMRLTLQPRPSSRTPGPTVLQGFIGL